MEYDFLIEIINIMSFIIYLNKDFFSGMLCLADDTVGMPSFFSP